MYICIFIDVSYVCIYVYTYIYIFVYIYTYVNILYVYVYMNEYSICISLSISIHVYIKYVYLYAYIYIYRQTLEQNHGGDHGLTNLGWPWIAQQKREPWQPWTSAAICLPWMAWEWLLQLLSKFHKILQMAGLQILISRYCKHLKT